MNLFLVMLGSGTTTYLFIYLRYIWPCFS